MKIEGRNYRRYICGEEGVYKEHSDNANNTKSV